ncbi:CMD domain protein [Sinirhodobacter populi]|uniref:CMD domain protein n=1 Tax=Paenirhodobacter populi TaxID=2306993 RepID=A0A443K3M2_9RHOB|nr:CMD domain protein [Sinirhodobacter populi]
MTGASVSNRTLIETLARIPEGSAIAAAYAARSDARAQAELSYRLLLSPQDEGPVSLTERYAVAALVAALYGEPATRDHYAGLLRGAAPDLADRIATEARSAEASGPWGHFPAGPLSVEDQPGTGWEATPERVAQYGARLAAALAHTHLLVLHPRDSSPEALAALLAAGWDEDGIVVLSQLVAFVSFQIRVVAGFSALVAARAKTPA